MSKSTQLFHGVVGAKGLLYVPPGYILIERSMGNTVWGVQMSVIPALPRSSLETLVPYTLSESCVLYCGGRGGLPELVGHV
eukprot:2127892-Alexandrium_andersonii.AAC.1